MQKFMELFEEKAMYQTYDEYYPDSGSMPTHVAIIADGGRRWAQRHGCSYYISYRAMCEKLFEYCKYMYDYGVQVISLYFSSSLNFKRNRDEIDSFCKAEIEFLDKYVEVLKEQYGARPIIVGQTDSLPENMIEAIKNVPKWDNNGDKKLYMCINYNPHKEIENAFAQVYSKGGLYINYLEVKEPINVFIRTGGAKVISNFLLPQLGFANLFFLDTLFNDTDINDIKAILETYKNSQLKYGE